MLKWKRIIQIYINIIILSLFDSKNNNFFEFLKNAMWNLNIYFLFFIINDKERIKGKIKYRKIINCFIGLKININRFIYLLLHILMKFILFVLCSHLLSFSH